MKSIRGLTTALNQNGRFPYKNPDFVVDHLVVGAGLYYPPNSLKTKLCLRGRDLMYERCRSRNIPFKQTGKLVVALKDQRDYIEGLHSKSLAFDPTSFTQDGAKKSTHEPILPTQLLTGDEARDMEPDLSRGIVAALWCPKTGIVDSHTFMQSLEQDIIDSPGGELVYSTKLVRIDPHRPSSQAVGSPDLNLAEHGWVVQTLDSSTSSSGNAEPTALLARTLINTGGLSSTTILNSILPPHLRIPIYYARGSYASYHGPGISSVSHLIYPCPPTGPNAHAFESLGTHLTLDLQGKVRFGPDLEWLSAPEPNAEGTEGDFWKQQLVPDGSRMETMHRAVKAYLSGVALDGFQPDYVGVRPKLIPPGKGFQDFIVREDYGSEDTQRDRKSPMISLLGIESPGLTSSLAIAEVVVDDLRSRTG